MKVREIIQTIYVLNMLIYSQYVFYILGGERSDGRNACSCEIYDPQTDTWSEAGVLVEPRANHCCAVYGDSIYCAGGDFGIQSHDNFW